MACTTVLGDFEVAPESGLTGVDASLDVNAGDAQQQQQAPDGGDAGPAVIACKQATDCPPLPMEPANCALARCEAERCVYVPVDKDNDTHPMAGCKVDGKLIPGDDCADSDPQIFPGRECSKTPDGRDIVFPTGAPTGTCKAGRWDCAGGTPRCQGAVLPAPADDCTAKNDANCNGIEAEGCQCVPNTVEPCGNEKNLPLPCKAGTRTCNAEGKWGLCTGNVEAKARDCSSTVDNNCDGTADQAEAACACPGGITQGKQGRCSVAGGLGQCAPGLATCQPSADKTTGVFGTCTGDKPTAPNCGSASDYDCNGVSDQLQVECGSPCTDGAPTKLPTRVPAAQKFNNGMWGCAGTSSFDSRGWRCTTSAQGVGSHVCSVDEWTKYGSRNGAVPTYKYWVSEVLKYGSDTNGCFASVNTGSACSNADGTTASMSVCPATAPDPLGNACNWVNCDVNAGNATANDYLGGCNENKTAGTLCCQ